DLEIERARAARPCGDCRGGEERATDTAVAIRRLDVQLLQPHRWTAVLDRPGGRQRGDADDPPVQRRDEDGSALGGGHEPVERCGDGGRRCRDLVLAELCHEERERRIAVGGLCGTDVWLAHDDSDAGPLDEAPYSRSLCARYSATSTRPFAAPRRVLCDRATYLSPFASAGSGRTRPTPTTMPASASRSSRGCGRKGSSCTAMGRRGALGRSS